MAVSSAEGRTGVRADFGDRADFENADRDFITSLDPMVIKAADGRVVWDMSCAQQPDRHARRAGPTFAIVTS
jgi:alkyl sulfatase BDS1-like metallo-beta-lactamase superfamily hydrolase